ncbi:transglutaminase domain-containing protein [Ferruginibacter sp. SUN106]|uniref:transglutaminase domain-containing protein n=1 Tax=Ferruginibacter sp. SUN106 TaxID=2978348 RepID=UPI003D36EB54
MKHISKKIFTLLLVCIALNCFAQKEGKDFKAIDEYVKKLGTLDSLNMGTISSLLTKNYSDKTDKVRAIYDWIAYNIAYDLKNAGSGSGDKNTSTEVLLRRKATGAGYATLFQDMCSSAGIRCLTADGFVKFGADQINDTKTEINHSWAVVQLGQSPEAWYYADPCWGAGYTDAEFKTFTKAFNPDYFFADLTIFNWQHYPDNMAWQLGPGPKNKKDFFGMPVIKSAAYELGLKKMNPNDGVVKVKVNKPLAFSYQLNSNATVTKVALVFGEGKKKKIKDVPFSFSGNMLGFTYKFEEEDSFPVTVLVNGKELAEYMVDIE